MICGGEALSQIFDLSSRGKNMYQHLQKNCKGKLVAKTFFWQNILRTPKNVPAPTSMPAVSFTVIVCGNVPE